MESDINSKEELNNTETDKVLLHTEISIVITAALLGPALSTVLLIRNLKVVRRYTEAVLLFITIQGYIVLSESTLDPEQPVPWWILDCLVVIALVFITFKRYFSASGSFEFRTSGNTIACILCMILFNGLIRLTLRSLDYDLNLTSMISSGIVLFFGLLIPSHSRF